LKSIVTPRRSPRCNGFCERVIGTLRRECTDHVIALGDRHLSRLLRKFVTQRHGRRYVSYVCQTAQKQGIKACPGSRAPSHEVDRFVVEQLAAIGKDPALQAETARAARDALKDRRAELRETESRARADLARLDAERARLSGDGPEVAQRLDDIAQAAEDATRRLHAAQAETRALAGARLRKDDLRDALGAFMPLWGTLFPAERRRIITLAIEQVVYDAQAGALTIDYRLDGIEVLAREARA